VKPRSRSRLGLEVLRLVPIPANTNHFPTDHKTKIKYPHLSVSTADKTRQKQ